MELPCFITLCMNFRILVFLILVLHFLPQVQHLPWLQVVTKEYYYTLSELPAGPER